MSEKLTRTQTLAETIVRVCPMRDAVCPHRLSCPYVGDGPYGYPCKEGWSQPLSDRSKA